MLPILSKMRSRENKLFVALHLTHNCNQRCDYCYGGHKFKSSISIETAQQCVEFLLSQPQGRCVITLFGGEPLLEYDLIRELVPWGKQRAKEAGKSLGFRMSTNGLLLNDERLGFLVRNKIRFSLSIDGCRDAHLKHRGTAKDWERLTARIPMILGRFPYTPTVSVVTPQNVAFLDESVRFLTDQGFRYQLFTLAHDVVWTTADMGVFEEQLERVAEYYVEVCRAGGKLFINYINEKVKTLVEGPNERGRECDLARSQFAIAPSGRIYPCVQFVGDDTDHEWAIGDVFSGFDEERRQKVVRLNLSDREHCQECAFDGRCHNFCGCINWRTTGDITRIPSTLCESQQRIIPIADRVGQRLIDEENLPFLKRHYCRDYPLLSAFEDLHGVDSFGLEGEGT